MRQELKDPDVAKLKDRHPATSGNVYGANDPNIDRVDSTLPDSPTFISRPSTLIWR